MQRRQQRRFIPYPILILFAVLIPGLALFAASPCQDCHEEQVGAYAGTPHARVVARDAQFCASCHGDPHAHLASNATADIIGGAALSKWTGEQKARACARCHAKDFPAWQRAPHAEEGLCWSCHAREAVHAKVEPELPPARAHRTWALCTSCHAQQGAELGMVYRHPVQSGQVDCTDCHDIHGRSVLRNELVEQTACLECHEEQKGPFLFEHGAMEQGCTSCHAAHGSPYRGQLLTSGNGTCMTCHLQTDFPAVGKTSHGFLLSGGGRCWDCHSEIHGSNTTQDLNPRGRR
jgi:DmsE family decaheme c-type cytochrome